MFNVSTKTISRWRQQGLVSRRFVFDGRKRVGFLKSSVEQFVARNEDRVRRGTRFSQLTADERGEMIERARRLASAGGCLADVTKRVARHLGRSVETVRYTLKQFDEEHPDLAIFPEQHGPADRRRQEDAFISSTVAARRSRRLAQRYHRTKTSDLSRDQRDASPADHGVAAGLHSQSAVRPRRARKRRFSAPMPESEVPLKKTRLPAGLAAVPGQPVRGAAADARAGSALVPQVQLPEVQGGEAARASSIRPAPKPS